MSKKVPKGYVKTETVVREEFWTTRDGRRLAVGEMDIDHLRNTLRMILARARARRLLKLRREAAEMAALADLDDDKKWGDS